MLVIPYIFNIPTCFRITARNKVESRLKASDLLGDFCKFALYVIYM